MSFTFSSDIWRDFDDQTKDGIAPYLFEGVLPLSDGFAGFREVEKAFFSLFDEQRRAETDCRARIYVGEDRRDDLVEELYAQTPRNAGGLVEFMQEYTGAPRFSLVLNNLEQASARLAGDFSDFAQSFFSARGFPIGGTEQAVFCGNYSGTAFGVHEGFEHALLCHLGPGVKNFYCWSREAYLSIADGREPTFSNSPAFDRLFDNAELFVLKPGDVLYLPAAVYHIGRQNEYSVSVALPLYTYPYTRFVSRAVLPALCDLSLPFDQEGMSPFLPLNGKNPFAAPITDLLHSTCDQWFTRELPRFLSYYWNRLRSNGGWDLPQRLAADMFADCNNAPAFDLSPGQSVRLLKPYAPIVEPDLDCAATQTRVFLAARSVVADAQDVDVERICGQLGRHEPVAAATHAEIAFLQELSRTGALERI